MMLGTRLQNSALEMVVIFRVNLLIFRGETRCGGEVIPPAEGVGCGALFVFVCGKQAKVTLHVYEISEEQQEITQLFT